MAEKKTPASKTSDEKKHGLFDELYDRAKGKGEKRRADFILGEAEGFDPPIVITSPDLFKRRLISVAQQKNDGFGVLEAAVGDPLSFGRILERLNEYGDDAPAMLGALGIKVIDHFFGRGASEAPGGSQES
ncbi:hypothetical protein [Rhodococcus opacus]|uniref:Tail assembly chaperone n=1 Tax=Rhodococcus opacus (strain B4) TaxID=632772 RepID=C1B9E0_RHOOB|nr:hypothetical protein [Rhodococcus opacus]BAH52293.1 hypothetical protein ROP_40460 [Rhodococcus opacus B4]